ncbi:CHAT domain-containing protein [Mycena alexandri]|uniref:CHAT domain-containing protein n=1 Tax=Mycena alexandri TaxID=1745969 RepID=A0AAD6XBL9_9AGAR|nr:CHAT domain-containing protein [Mycena alexandri]
MASLRELENSRFRRVNAGLAYNRMMCAVASYQELIARVQNLEDDNVLLVSNSPEELFSAYDLVVAGLKVFQDSHSVPVIFRGRRTVPYFLRSIGMTFPPSDSAASVDRLGHGLVALKYLGYMLLEDLDRFQGIEEEINNLIQDGVTLINNQNWDEALSHFHDIAHSYPRERYPHPNRFKVLQYLGYCQAERFKFDRHPNTLRTALGRLRESQDFCPAEHPSLPGILNDIGLCLTTAFDHYRYTHDIGHEAKADLTAAIRHFSTACRLEENATHHRSLGHAYIQLFGFTYDRVLLEKAFRCFESIEISSLGAFDRAIVEFDISRAHSEWYEMIDSKRDHLDKAASAVSDAQYHFRTAHTTSSRELLSCKLQCIAVDRMLFEIDLNPATLEGAIHDLKEVLAFDPLPPDIKHSAKASLAQVLVMCDYCQGNPVARNAAIEILKTIPNRGGLSYPLLSRYLNSGTTVDLWESIKVSRETSVHEPSIRPGGLQSLSNGLLKRFSYLGLPQDIEEAVECSKKCLYYLPEKRSEWSLQQHRLAAALLARFDAFRDQQDLDEALELHCASLRITLPLYQPVILLDYSKALHVRWKTTGRMKADHKDLVEAISLVKDIPCSPQNVNPLARIHLSEYLCDAFNCGLHIPASNPLAEAEQHLKFVNQRLPDLHPLRAQCLRNIAIVLFARKKYELAFKRLSDATEYESATARERLRICMVWINLAMEIGHESALEAFLKAITLREECMLLSPDVGNQWEFLCFEKEGASLASRAATLAINQGKEELAVEILEQGRNLIWSEMGSYRQSLGKLEEKYPDLFEALRDVSREMEYNSLLMSELREAKEMDVHIQKRDEFLQDRRTILEEIRGLEGFQNFWRRVKFDELKKAAEEGPVVIVNISSTSHALILSSSTAAPVSIPLPNMNTEDVEVLVVDLSKAQEIVSEASQDAAARANQETAASAEFEKILKRLWDDLVLPAEKALVADPSPEHPRIWWCMTGKLGTLPVHAAGILHSSQYVSSCTSNLTALIAARRAHSTPSQATLLLVGGIGDSNVGEEQGLTCVGYEMERIIDKSKVATDQIDFSNRDAVLAHLPRHSWVHFACHGEQDDTSPFKSCLYRFSDIKLTLLDIMRTRLPHAELAVLSACNTASGDVSRTPDETLHIAQGLQFCGFRSVVGTLWTTMDKEGAQVFPYFYHYMRHERSSAIALHKTIKLIQLRHKVDLPVYKWANYVHLGA